MTQAEAVLGIIRSKSEEALRAATRTLRGELASFAMDIHQELLALSARMEVALDFPEEDIPLHDDDEILQSIYALCQSLEDLLDRCNTGFLLGRVSGWLLSGGRTGEIILLNALLKNPAQSSHQFRAQHAI